MEAGANRPFCFLVMGRVSRKNLCNARRSKLKAARKSSLVQLSFIL